MATKPQQLEQKVECSICSKELDPTKPLKEKSVNRDLSSFEGFYCLDCWLRALRKRTAESMLAKATDRVLLE